MYLIGEKRHMTDKSGETSVQVRLCVQEKVLPVTLTPLTFDLVTLQALSACLLAVARAARQPHPERLPREALLALRASVPFRSAWWGECSDGQADTPRRNWLHGRINLSESFAQEWNQLAASDAFAAASMRNCGAIVLNSGHEASVPEVSAFSQRHDLFHRMALTMDLPGSGLMFFVALYRSEESRAFDDNEGALFAEFAAHLVHHWQACVQDFLGSASIKSFEGFALTDACGDLLYVGKRLGAAIHQAHPGWGGSRLPVDMLAALRQVPSAISVGGCGLTLQPCGALVALALDDGSRQAVLPPRERTVAILYSQGHSNKVIAKQLNLSPATVRTYLRNAYLQLGVCNKIELGAALNASSAHGYP